MKTFTVLKVRTLHNLTRVLEREIKPQYILKLQTKMPDGVSHKIGPLQCSNSAIQDIYKVQGSTSFMVPFSPLLSVPFRPNIFSGDGSL